MEHLDLMPDEIAQAKGSIASLAFECTGTSCSYPRFSWNRSQRVPPRVVIGNRQVDQGQTPGTRNRREH